MLTLYLVCLAVGAVFVGASIFAGHDHDLGGGGSDVGGHDFGHDAGHDLGGHDLGDHDLSGHGDHGAHPSLPFLSLRFWTFAAFFFGLAGVGLRELADTGEPTTALASAAVGALAGTGATWLLRRLRHPVGATHANEYWVGQVGELLHPLGPGQVSKLVVKNGGRPNLSGRELLAVLAGPDQRPLERGTRVLILAIEDGKAVVQLDPTLTSPMPASVAPQAQEEKEEV